LHEPKLDGYRFQIAKDGRQVRLYSRSGHEWTKRLASACYRAAARLYWCGVKIAAMAKSKELESV